MEDKMKPKIFSLIACGLVIFLMSTVSFANTISSESSIDEEMMSKRSGWWEEMWFSRWRGIEGIIVREGPLPGCKGPFCPKVPKPGIWN